MIYAKFSSDRIQSVSNYNLGPANHLTYFFRTKFQLYKNCLFIIMLMQDIEAVLLLPLVTSQNQSKKHGGF